jgi:5-methylcytosine-specific restriction endonuclease McrA
MGRALYDSLQWRRVRRAALARDGGRCSVSLLGGSCSPGPLSVHHLTPVADGGASFDLDNLLTCCRRHHPMLEAFRRRLLTAAEPADPEPPRCRHRHVSEESRAQCETRLRRRWERQRAVVA